jgi:hypothetical protein
MPSTLSVIKFLLVYGSYIWVIPPIRQYKQRLFYYFLFMAFGDPIQRLITHNNFTMPSNYYTTFSYILLAAILWNKKSPKLNYLLIAGGIVIFILSSIVFKFTYDTDKLFFLGLQIIILFLFLKKFITDYTSYSKINVFQLVLVFFQLTVVSKIGLFILGTSNAIAFYIITSTIGIAFGLYFSIYREDKTKFPA